MITRILLEIREIRDITVIVFVDSTIIPNSPSLAIIGQRLYELIEKQSKKKIILDFQPVYYMSKPMIAKILGLHKRTRASGGTLVICNIFGNVLEKFETMRLDKVFTIVNDITAAMALMR